MTPKEKAQEIYLKYSGYVNEEYPHTNTIKCALIAVDEIISSQGYQLITDGFWKEVRKEIELL